MKLSKEDIFKHIEEYIRGLKMSASDEASHNNTLAAKYILHARMEVQFLLDELRELDV